MKKRQCIAEAVQAQVRADRFAFINDSEHVLKHEVGALKSSLAQ
ncbi:685_t:CDS:2 [Dentiscutata erythropus]|uniref:685_t:CDS:1 n=1 Tax=Dentiscutata erythropus TaxID=1348616 RepID=A0A9N9N3L1_9GLOM|nr:685_t:CDS:2 [Dentiscutata erythropus]